MFPSREAVNSNLHKSTSRIKN